MKSKCINTVLASFCCLYLLTACGGGSSSQNNSSTPDIYVAQTNIEFGGTMLNNTVNKTVYIKNNGKSDLKINQISIPGSTSPFSIDSNSDGCSNKTLKPGATGSLTIFFTPKEQNTLTGTLSIPSNDPDSPAKNIALKGNGYGLDVIINNIDTSTCPISIDVTVLGPGTGGPVAITNLDSDSLQIYQDGSSTPLAIDVPNSIKDPVSTVLALDLSGSLTNDIVEIRSAAKNFISLLDANDEAAICKFRNEIEFNWQIHNPGYLNFVKTDTDGINALYDYIEDDFDYVDDGTALFNALYDSVNWAYDHGQYKKAVIVLSDGVNEFVGGYTQDNVTSNATSKQIPIYSIYYSSSYYSDGGKPAILGELAKNTGGLTYSGESTNLESIFQKISYTLTNKYTLSIPSCTAGTTLTIEVRAEYPDPNDPGNTLYGSNTITINL